MHSSSPYHEHRNNRFDFLRLLAAWLVLFSHSYPIGGWPQNEPLINLIKFDSFGGLGVCIFFVLSGYLVTQSLERSQWLPVFAWRRIIRIYPALIAACIFCIVVGGLWLTPLGLAEYFTHPQTWQYLWTATGWDIRYSLPLVFAENPYPHAVNGSLWSLPYEIQCYIVLALISLAPIAIRWKALTIFIVLLMAWFTRPDSYGVFERHIGLNYFDIKLGLLFSLGAVLSSWRDRIHLHGAYGIAFLVIAYFSPWMKFTMISFYMGFAMVVLWLALYGRWLPVIPEKMGDWSYGTYLYGFPVQQTLAFLGVQAYGVFVFTAASTVLTLILAAASWFIIEKPAIGLKGLVKNPKTLNARQMQS